MKKIVMMLVVGVVIWGTDIALSDNIRGIDIDFVTIGHAGNAGDTRAEANPNGCGAVSYEYRIGMYEINNAQWKAFTAAAGAPTGNPGVAYDRSLTDECCIGFQQPTSCISWYETLQFCNYLTSGDKSKGVYPFSGNNANPGDFLGINRAAAQATYGMIYFLPTEDEWYKAAYYKPDGSGYSTYANGEEGIPAADNGWNYNGGTYVYPWNVGTGTMEQNGTYDMMGNVWEWNDTPLVGDVDDRYSVRGGSCYLGSSNSLSSFLQYGFDRCYENDGGAYIGFRVASIVDTIHEIDMEFVTIGNHGNDPDTGGTPGCGGVNYTYHIGTYEVTNDQWNAFTTAAGVPTGNPSNAYDVGTFYTGAQQPTTGVGWYEAAQFCNYLTSGDKSKGVYQFSGDNVNPGDFLAINRGIALATYGAIYCLPTVDEWYKAAYYKPDGSGYSLYANGLNTVPLADNGWNYGGGLYSTPWDVGTGTEEQNGTFDMMGNVWEWNETAALNRPAPSYVAIGGSFLEGDYAIVSSHASLRIQYDVNPDYQVNHLGFRVAYINELPTLSLYAPNGSEFLPINTNYNIIWDSQGSIENVLLEYSIDNGGSWVSIGSVVNTGFYGWMVPNTPSNECLIRISDADNAAVSDVSDSTFIIFISYPTLLSPNGDEELLAGVNYPITWKTTGVINEILIEYSTDNGSNWTEVSPANIGNTGTYDWLVPAVISEECLIRVSDKSNAHIYDCSNNVFHIDFLNLLSPNGGESILTNSEFGIKWDYSPLIGDHTILIAYSTNQGQDWNEIISTDNDGIYEWQVPDLIANQCLIKVSDYTDPNYGLDQSENTFKIYSCKEEILGDINGDCIVDLTDFALMAANWLQQGYINFHQISLDDNPHWQVEGQWAFGQPTGSGGTYGNPDPNTGFSGANVYGVNLEGDYATDIGGPYNLTAGPFYCKQYRNIQLKFARWLNSDTPMYVKNAVEVSNDGVDWTIVWEPMEPTAITDDTWQMLEYDISTIADGEESVFIRWSYTINERAYQYSGWNIDDVELWGNPH